MDVHRRPALHALKDPGSRAGSESPREARGGTALYAGANRLWESRLKPSRVAGAHRGGRREDDARMAPVCAARTSGLFDCCAASC
jgi:hypothetical protein